MQQDPNQQQPQFPPSAASNLLHESHATSQAAVAAAAAQRAQAPPTRPNSNAAPPQGQHLQQPRAPIQRQHVQQHHLYSHAAHPQMPQYRRSVPQQGANPSAGYYGGYGNINNMNPANSMNSYMNSMNNINSHPQNYINPTANYGMSAPYGGHSTYQYRGPGAAPGAPGSIGNTGAPMQNRSYQGASVPMDPVRRAPVVPQRRPSKALAIVNPDTNEEVKIDKKEKDAKDKATDTNPKAHTTNSRKPLDVVAPANANSNSISNTDATKKESSARVAPQISQENKSSPPAKLVSDQVVDKIKTDVTVSAESAVKVVASAVADTNTEKVAAATKESGSKLATAAVETGKNDAVAPVINENKTDVNQSSSSTITAEPHEAKPSNVESATSVIVAATSEPANNEPTAAADSPVSASPPKRERPAGPVFKEGERRKYSIGFFRSTSNYIERGALDSYNSLLLKHNISKNQGGSRQDSGGGRRSGGGRNTSGDPRGNRVLPHGGGGGYSGARGPGVLGVGGGGMEFNLDQARQNRPPPNPKNRGNNDYNRGGNRSGRNQGPQRGGHGPLDVHEKLKKSEHHWSGSKDNDSELEAKLKVCRSLLNKLTIDKFDKLSGQILDIKISTPEEAQAMVSEIFEKVLFEPAFSSMYAKLCKKLNTATKEMFEKTNYKDAKGKPMTFRKVLLKLCQTEFAKGKAAESIAQAEKEKEEKAAANGEEGQGGMTKEEKKEAEMVRVKAKRRTLGNIQFIGALYVVDLISEAIVHRDCLQNLLSLGITHKEEDTIETFSKLMTCVGKKVQASAPGPLQQYFSRVELMSRDKTLSNRIRFMLIDLIELKNNNWVPRRNEGEMKTMEEIRKEVEEEHRKKDERAQQLQRMSRSGRGGGRHHHNDRRRHNEFSSSGMTMAASQRSQGPSRAQATLDKYSNRMSGRQSGGNAPNVSFRPGGGSGARTTNGWSSVLPNNRNRSSSGSTPAAAISLRPGRANEESASNSSGDVRRGNKFSYLSQTPKEPVVEGPKPKSDEDCKKKARSLMTEYLGTSDAKELKECIEEEVGPANALKFTEFALKEALNLKMAQRAAAGSFFQLLPKDNLVAWSSLCAGFANVICNLNDIAIDDPRASENIARYLAAMYVNYEGKDEEKSESGLEFLKPALADLYGKNPSKFVIQFLSEYEKILEKGEEKVDAKAKVLEAYNNIGYDLVGSIMNYNPMRGISLLEDMLKDMKVEYLLPDLPVTKMLLEEIPKDTSGKDMLAKLTVDKDVMKTAEFSANIILRAFTVYFSNTTAKINEKLAAGAGQLVKLVNGAEDKSPPAETQMAILLALEPSLHELDSSNDAAPLDAEYKGKKHAAVAFDALYDCDVVEEETYLEWKKGNNVKDGAEARASVLLQTAAWFKWLAEAEEAG